MILDAAGDACVGCVLEVAVVKACPLVGAADAEVPGVTVGEFVTDVHTFVWTDVGVEED